MRRTPIVALIAILIGTQPVHCEDKQLEAPAAQCLVGPEQWWSDQEKLVWSKACVGEVADFNKRHGADELDPKLLDDLPEDRTLRPSFLTALLSNERYRQLLKGVGLRIVGAKFEDLIDLEGAELQFPLRMDRCLLKKGANLVRLRSSSFISFEGSKITGPINLSKAAVDEDVFMDGADIAEANFSWAKIGRRVELAGSKVSGRLNMNSISIGRMLFMRNGSQFKDVDLIAARIGDLADFSRSVVTGTLQMYDVSIGQRLLMSKTKLAKVDLSQSSIGGLVDFDESTVTGPLSMYELIVGKDVQMRNGKFESVSLQNAKIEGIIQITNTKVPGDLNLNAIVVGKSMFLSDGSELTRINLVGARIGGQLDVDGSAVTEMFEANGIEVRQHLSMRRGTFADVSLGKAHIGGTVDLSGATISKSLDMEGMDIGQNVELDDGKFPTIELSGTRVRGQVTVSSSEVGGALEGENLNVGLDCFLRNSKFERINLAGSVLKANFELSKATINEIVDMDGAEIGQDFLIEEGGSFGYLKFDNTRIKGDVILAGLKVDDRLSMVGSDIGQDLRIRDGAQFGSVGLNNAHIKGDVTFSGVNVSGELLMVGIDIGQDLWIKDSSRFQEIRFSNARVKGKTDIDKSVVSEVYVQGTEFGQNFFVGNGSEIKVLNLVRAHVKGETNLSVSKLSGELRGEAFQADGSVLLHGRFEGSINFSLARFASHLNLAGGTFLRDVNLSGSQILGTLVLSANSPTKVANWTKPDGGQPPGLLLKNASLNLLPSMSDMWPSGIDISGLLYRDLVDTDVSSFARWLTRHESFRNNGYAQQPYEQLARVLQNRGQLDDVIKIRYASKEKERNKVTGLTAAGQWILKWVIGYGYYVERALVAVVFVVLLGAAVLRISGRGPAHGMPYGLAYSFDMLLPVVKLREEHYKYDLNGWPRYYFYVHKVAGYVLASFLIAGLSGLTK
jgi:uncharacterized protein YjbI with pentapeptide repeats